jgi:hypothetical protein
MMGFSVMNDEADEVTDEAMEAAAGGIAMTQIPTAFYISAPPTTDQWGCPA